MRTPVSMDLSLQQTSQLCALNLTWQPALHIFSMEMIPMWQGPMESVLCVPGRGG